MIFFFSAKFAVVYFCFLLHGTFFSKNFSLCCQKDYFLLASLVCWNLLGPFLALIRNGRINQGLTLTRVYNRNLNEAHRLSQVGFQQKKFPFSTSPWLWKPGECWTVESNNSALKSYSSTKATLPRASRCIEHMYFVAALDCWQWIPARFLSRCPNLACLHTNVGEKQPTWELWHQTR